MDSLEKSIGQCQMETIGHLLAFYFWYSLMAPTLPICNCLGVGDRGAESPGTGFCSPTALAALRPPQALARVLGIAETGKSSFPSPSRAKRGLLEI